MAAPADLGLKGEAPEALDTYVDPSSLDAPQALPVVDFVQTKGLADIIAEGKLSTVLKFSYNQVFLAQREPLLYSDPNTLVVGSHDVDLPIVVASRGTAVRSVVYAASSIGKATASYSVQLTAVSREAGAGELAAHAPVVGTSRATGATGAATTATSRGEVAGSAPHSDDEQSSVEGLRDGVADDLDGPAVLPVRDVGRRVLGGSPARGPLGSVSAEIPGRDPAGHPLGSSSVRGPLGDEPARLLHGPRRLLPGDVGVAGDAASAVSDDSIATSVLLRRSATAVPDAELAAPVSDGVASSALHPGGSGCGDVSPVRAVGDLGATPTTASVPAAASSPDSGV